jgi:2,3-bisphosphoglycerate-dependent phosphoglycerate mutase
MSTLIMMRHGQSKWNQMNLFTGWVDVPLSDIGIKESLEGGKLIKDIPIDIIFTSSLIRAQMTAFLAMIEHSSGKVPVLQHLGEGQLEEWGQIYNQETKKTIIPVIADRALNERMYGKLQGLNKKETIEKYGAEQVKIWRRSFKVQPPEGESLEMTAARSIPFFNEHIIPYLEKGLNVFISAHGNSIRSIIMELDGLTEDEVVHLEIATGAPLIYEYANGNFTKRQ